MKASPFFEGDDDAPLGSLNGLSLWLNCTNNVDAQNRMRTWPAEMTYLDVAGPLSWVHLHVFAESIYTYESQKNDSRIVTCPASAERGAKVAAMLRQRVPPTRKFHGCALGSDWPQGGAYQAAQCSEWRDPRHSGESIRWINWKNNSEKNASPIVERWIESQFVFVDLALRFHLS